MSGRALPRRPWQRALRHPSFLAGGLLALLVLGAAFLSLWWTPWSPYAMDMAQRLAPPGGTHWLGTDAFGRDVASLLLVGARSSLLAGVVAVGIGLVVGTALGLLAAARRGWVEELVMRLADFSFAFPAVLSAILFTAAWGAGLVNAIVAIGIFNIPVFARVNTCWRRAPAARGYSASHWSMCCPTSPPPSSCRPPCSLRWRFWPRRRCPIWAWARSRRNRPGAVCWLMRKP